MADTTTSQEAVQTENQETQTNGSEATATEQPDSSIPQKFVGKSQLEIIQAYNNLEKHASRVSSERAEERKNREQLEARMRELESRQQAQPPQQVVQQVREIERAPDPFSDYDAQFDKDPKDAIKHLVASTEAKVRAQLNQELAIKEQSESAEWHNQQTRSNPEYSSLQPEMRRLAQEYAHLVNPSKVNSVQVLKLLHLAAKGAKAEDIAKAAATKAKAEKQAVNDEKRQAFSEGNASGGDARVNFADLSVSEMEKVLGIDRR